MATTSASPVHSIASASASNTPQAHPLPQQQQQQQPQAASPVRPPPLPTAFEFTRRKKWADLLITELTDAIVFVLSPQAKVLFCSHAVQELLGWKDDEIVDRDLFDWVHAADHETLRASLLQSQHDNREMLSYARLRCKPDAFQPLHAQAPPPPVILFELAARPHTVPGEHSSRCIFTVAKPYPSRNTAMLNTFLELKIENARLQDRLHALRTHQSTHPLPRPHPHPHPRTHSQTYNPPASSSSSAPASAVTTAVAPSLQLAIDTRDPQAYFAALGAPLSAGPGSASAGGPGLDDDEGGDKLRKKRKVSAPEQYVCNTCGRTDSPEWRKGPRGPKTLCNACGLRWAKKVRKFEEGGGEASQQPLDDIVPP